MMSGFSEATQYWIQKGHVLLSAEDRFKREWSGILEETQRRMMEAGWPGILHGEPFEFLQISRPRWHNAGAAAHSRAQEPLQADGLRARDPCAVDGRQRRHPVHRHLL